jgi:hypothetical protein
MARCTLYNIHFRFSIWYCSYQSILTKHIDNSIYIYTKISRLISKRCGLAAFLSGSLLHIYEKQTTWRYKGDKRVYVVDFAEFCSPWSGCELATLVIISTDCIGSCKSNYHTITTTMTSTLAICYLYHSKNLLQIWSRGSPEHCCLLMHFLDSRNIC